MGEYFIWVNADKKEYIDPYDFDYGNKFRESMTRQSEVLCALYALLAADWKGCRIGWIGDECLIPENYDMPFFDLLREDSKKCGDDDCIIDIVLESYRNVSCGFKSSEKVVRKAVARYFEVVEQGYDDEFDKYQVAGKSDPFEGMFVRDGMRFEYIINYTKKVCYSFSKTRFLDFNGKYRNDLDPLPVLMGYGRVTSCEPGPWLGDIIGVSDAIDETITVLDHVNLY